MSISREELMLFTRSQMRGSSRTGTKKLSKVLYSSKS